MCVKRYLDCGCAPLEDGPRIWCPTCGVGIVADQDERASIERWGEVKGEGAVKDRPRGAQARRGEGSDKLAYSIKEAATALSISEWLVKEQIYQGRICAKKVGARVVIPRWALDEWLRPKDSHNCNPPGGRSPNGRLSTLPAWPHS